MQTNRRQLRLLARSYLIAAAVMSIVFLMSGPFVRTIIAGAMMLLVVPAGFIARRVHSFPKPFTAGLAAVGALYVLEAVAADVVSGSISAALADSFDLIATTGIIALSAFLVSRRRGGLTAGDLLDGLIIGTGAWVVSWIVFVEPYIHQSNKSMAVVVFNGLYLPTAVPLIVLAAIVVFGAGRPQPAAIALSFGLLCNVTGDVLYALEEVRNIGAWSYTAADVLYIFSVASCAAAFVHPTAPALVGCIRQRTETVVPGRLTAVVLSQSVPVALVTLVTATTQLDRVVRTLSALVIMAFVSLRLYTASRFQLRAQAGLARAIRTDELTALPNKRALLEATADSIDDLWESGSRPSLYLFDLDGFRNINDSLGHAVGDDLLAHVARRLDAAARSLGATVSRPSGDEFVVLDPTPTDEVEALHHASVLHAAFREGFETIGGNLLVTASCGVATMAAGQPTDAGELFRWADIAMYRAKASGRGRIVVFDASMSERVTSRLEIEHSLRGAIDRGELRLFHQPIINIEDASVCGLEALIRWQRPDGTIVSPADFIGIAEETGQIDEIGAWAVLEALTQLRTWIDEGVVSEGTTVSVNVSPRQLTDQRFAGVVREALLRSKMPAHLLWLEITESVMVENPVGARAVLEEIHSTGVQIALDDFGTGYSSLSLLQQFPIQRIKIDRAFVNSLVQNANDRALVRTIIGLGDSMGVDIVAEGVETVQQLRILRQLGCARAQGYLISRPVPADAMRSTISALDGLSQWPDFSSMIGNSPLERLPRRGR